MIPEAVSLLTSPSIFVNLFFFLLFFLMFLCLSKFLSKSFIVYVNTSLDFFSRSFDWKLNCTAL